MDYHIKSKDPRLKFYSGDCDALIHTRKPKGIDDKRAYLIGSGLGSLCAAVLMIRDAHMDGSKITFLEQLPRPGGCLDGRVMENIGYVARGGREIGHHFEVLWDIWSSVPSYEDPNVSILDHLYYINKDDPNFSKCRITTDRGKRYDNGKFNLGQDLAMELANFLMMSDESLQDKSIEDVFSDKLLNSDFWCYWRTMFAFENWHSALEMKLYMNRFIHHVGGLADLSSLQFTRRDQYTDVVLPMINYCKAHGCKFQYNVTVTNVEFNITDHKKVATKIVAHDADGNDCSIPLSENDLVYITNGSMTESSTYGSQDKPAPFEPKLGGCWEMWKNIAKQSPEFGHPEKFCSTPEQSNWESCTITVHDPRIVKLITDITQRTPYGGHICTGGIVTAKDSNWLASWTINRQEQYYGQPKDDVEVWFYGLFSDKPGNYVKKTMRECTGKEITEEWLYHIGAPLDQIEELADTCHAIPAMMPFITSMFMPRAFGDRPYVVPKDAVNFAFLGQFAETLDEPGRDTVFTTEYSGRTAMEAVYILCGVERAVPEVFASRYDVRYLLNGASELLDGQKPDIKLPALVKHQIAKKIKGTDVELLLKEYNII